MAPNLQMEFPEVTAAVRIIDMEMQVRKENIKFIETGSIAADSTFFQIFDFKLLRGNKILSAPFKAAGKAIRAGAVIEPGYKNKRGKEILFLSDVADACLLNWFLSFIDLCCEDILT